MIRVLIVDDSKLAAVTLKEILSQDPEISVVGIANNGRQGVDMAKQFKPDLITMDINMPVMDGFEATQHIMAEQPTPVLVVSASVFKEGQDKVFKSLSYGALEVIDKSTLKPGGRNPQAEKDLIDKVKFLSRIRVMRHSLKNIEGKLEKSLNKNELPQHPSCKVVGIVSSTGGPQALRIILKEIPADFPCPIAIVQHISDGFVDRFIEWLNQETELTVEKAESMSPMRPGHVYIAPSERHMRVNKAGLIELTNEAPVDFQKPSGTILLQSLAESFGSRCLGVVLTGMGADGARGLKAIFDKGGRTIAQDEASSVVFGMPKAAIELGAARSVVTLDDIASLVIREIQK